MGTKKQELEKLNFKINDILEDFERNYKQKINITVYNGDKIKSNPEYIGDKLILDLGDKLNT